MRGESEDQRISKVLNNVSQPAKAGTVYLVGAGPGDPELITVKGLRLLRAADAVLYDRLAPAALLDEAPPQARRVDVGKAPGARHISQEAICQLMVELARDGKVVVRLKGGDPYVFGRGGEEALALAAAGIPFEVVPGISSAIAVPAYAGIPVTYQHIGRSFAVITGYTRATPEELVSQALAAPEAPQAPARAANNGYGREALDDGPHGSLEHWDWPALATVDTIVCLMGVANLPEIAEGLLAAGRSLDTPVAIVERGTTPDQRVVAGPLSAIAAIARAADVQPPAVIVIGNVVALHQALQPKSLDRINRIDRISE